MLALVSGAGFAQSGGAPIGGADEQITVPLHKSHLVRLPASIKKASVGNPKIADLLVVGPREIYLLGKSLGSTNVTLWSRNGKLMKILDVEVTHDLLGLKRKLHELMPGETFKLVSSRGDIILSGEVSSTPKLDAAVAIAQSYLDKDSKGKSAGKVLPLAQVGGSQQVMLEVRVAEVSRTLTRALDLNFNAFGLGSHWQIGAVNGGASFPTTSTGLHAPFITELKPDQLSITDKGLFASYLSGDFIFNSVLNIAKNNGLAKVLAEPNLTAVSGQEATFIAGGEFPIPVAQNLGAIVVKYKKFGVGLKFLPVVLDSGLISLKINVDVSELSSLNNAVINVSSTNATFVIPSLTKRAATTSVEIRSGQTIAIAGLINRALRETIDKVPGLGDVPVMGALFRSQQFLRDETELVIFVTPRLAKSVSPDSVRLPTDAFVEPSDTEFYLLGKLEGERKDKTRNVNKGADKDGPQQSNLQTGGGVEGGFGHAL